MAGRIVVKDTSSDMGGGKPLRRIPGTRSNARLRARSPTPFFATTAPVASRPMGWPTATRGGRTFDPSGGSDPSPGSSGACERPSTRCPEVTSVWSLPHATAPAGGTTCGTARDLLVLARLHLDEGRFDDSKYVVSPGSVAAMQERQIELPNTRPGDEAWGLGWALDVWGGEPVFGHDGGTIGQRAFLRIAPDKELAVALVSNAYTSGPLYEQLFRQVFEELRGIRMPQRPQPPEDARRSSTSAHIPAATKDGASGTWSASGTSSSSSTKHWRVS